MFIMSYIPFLLLNNILLYHRDLLNTFRPLQTNFLGLPLGHSCQCRPWGKPHKPLGLGNPPKGATNEKKNSI